MLHEDTAAYNEQLRQFGQATKLVAMTKIMAMWTSIAFDRMTAWQGWRTELRAEDGTATMKVEEIQKQKKALYRRMGVVIMTMLDIGNLLVALIRWDSYRELPREGEPRFLPGGTHTRIASGLSSCSKLPINEAAKQAFEYDFRDWLTVAREIHFQDTKRGNVFGDKLDELSGSLESLGWNIGREKKVE